MTGFYDDLETRDETMRAEWLQEALPAAIGRAKTAPAFARLLRDIDPADITDPAALACLPVIRKSDLTGAQKKNPPFGGFATRLTAEFDYIFQ
ncbi:MAG: phenylacetate--CoA ligase family protein, partial [Paracoccus sp. (in: a-proteobacteria)]